MYIHPEGSIYTLAKPFGPQHGGHCSCDIWLGSQHREVSFVCMPAFQNSS
jgi:hypothetical protein